MKNILILFFTMSVYSASAQTPYTFTNDNGTIILNGSITKYVFLNSDAFPWYAASIKNYKADTSLINNLAEAKNKINLVIFGGTWCEDTQNILPKFFVMQEKSGFPDSRISFFAADRNKHVNGNVSEAFAVTNVPTIIVMKNGKEVGRVVEYGKTGSWDKELSDIIKLALSN